MFATRTRATIHIQTWLESYSSGVRYWLKSCLISSPVKVTPSSMLPMVDEPSCCVTTFLSRAVVERNLFRRDSAKATSNRGDSVTIAESPLSGQRYLVRDRKLYQTSPGLCVPFSTSLTASKLGKIPSVAPCRLRRTFDPTQHSKRASQLEVSRIPLAPATRSWWMGCQRPPVQSAAAQHSTPSR